MTVDKRNGDIVVVRDDAIYYYGNRYGVGGRGPCYGYDGPKDLVALFEDYVALVCPPATTTTSNKSSTLRRFGGSQADEIFNTSTFTLLDTDLKFVAHSESLVSKVVTIFMIWGDLFTLLQNGKVRFLAILIEKKMYVNRVNRYIAIMRSRCIRDWRSCTNETSTLMQLIWHKSLAWMRFRKMSSIENLEIVYTKKVIMMAPCNNTSKLLIAQNPPRSLER